MLYRGRARATSASKVYNSSIDADLADGLKAFGPCWSPASETNTEAMTRSRDLRRVVHAIKHRDAAELLWAGEYCTDLIRQGDTTSGRLWRRVLERVIEAQTVRGRATGRDETFDFAIEPVGGGFSLSIRFSGGSRENITGAGVWPSVEKAKQIAEASAQLLDEAAVQWEGD